MIDVHDLERAWRQLGQGQSLAVVAARVGLKSTELERMIWHWRATVTRSTEEQHRSPEQMARLRRLAPHDRSAAKVLAFVEGRAAA